MINTELQSVILKPATKWSVSLTTKIDIINHTTPSESMRNGKVMSRNTPPRTRFTSPNINVKTNNDAAPCSNITQGRYLYSMST